MFMNNLLLISCCTSGFSTIKALHSNYMNFSVSCTFYVLYKVLLTQPAIRKFTYMYKQEKKTNHIE